MIALTTNEKYFVTLDIYTDHAREDIYFIVEYGEKNISGSYKRKIYSTGKAAYKAYQNTREKLYIKYGI